MAKTINLSEPAVWTLKRAIEPSSARQTVIASRPDCAKRITVSPKPWVMGRFDGADTIYVRAFLSLRGVGLVILNRIMDDELI